MEHLFAFTEKTLRLRRNLLIVSLICFAVGQFKVKITEAPFGGVKLEMPPETLEFSLAVIFIYLIIAFAINSTDEYQHWRASIADRNLALFDDSDPTQKKDLQTQLIVRLDALNNHVGKTHEIQSAITNINKCIDEPNNKDFPKDQVQGILHGIVQIERNFLKVEAIDKALQDVESLIKDYNDYWVNLKKFTKTRILILEITIPYMAMFAGVYGTTKFHNLQKFVASFLSF